ncbi:hypothetical protein [Gordonibacter sp. Marseille-P4307]|uniref:hypothetical protein n=1 Tax=Gordonibacter sp. Marseille-P4307 TaxID=2161815 RepID=UPI000F52304C|nr:hypothetical protein [Gordonibacter sp. Marseille-P4307]
MKPYEEELLSSMATRIEEMGIGTQTTTARVAKQCGCDDESVDMFGLDDALRKECARRGYRLDMSSHENMFEGLPYNLEFTVKAIRDTSSSVVPPHVRGSIRRLELGWVCMVGSMVRDYAFQRREDGGYDVRVELVGEPSPVSGTMDRDEAESFDTALQRIGVLGWRRPQYQMDRGYLITDQEKWHLAIEREGYKRRFLLDGDGQYPAGFEDLRYLVEGVGAKLGVPRAFDDDSE